MEIAKMVGDRLKQARKAQGITQEEAGKALGILQTAYSRFERGVFQLNYEQLIILCRLFDCSADYLLGLSDI